MSKRGELYVQWVMLLCETEAKGIFYDLRLFSDSPIGKNSSHVKV